MLLSKLCRGLMFGGFPTKPRRVSGRRKSFFNLRSRYRSKDLSYRVHAMIHDVPRRWNLTSANHQISHLRFSRMYPHAPSGILLFFKVFLKFFFPPSLSFLHSARKSGEGTNCCLSWSAQLTFLPTPVHPAYSAVWVLRYGLPLFFANIFLHV